MKTLLDAADKAGEIRADIARIEDELDRFSEDLRELFDFLPYRICACGVAPARIESAKFAMDILADALRKEHEHLVKEKTL